MTAMPTSLMLFQPALPVRYRWDERLDEREHAAAARHLVAARDAINLALLCVEGEAGQERAAQARSFMVEAVTAISRARIYIPGLRSYSVPVIMATVPEIEAEFARLHQMATRLLWWNHAWLPVRRQATPLEPEDEAQLAVLIQDLARNARIDRALRYRHIAAAVFLTALFPLLGMLAAGLAAGVLAAFMAAWTLAREARRTAALGRP